MPLGVELENSEMDLEMPAQAEDGARGTGVYERRGEPAAVVKAHQFITSIRQNTHRSPLAGNSKLT